MSTEQTRAEWTELRDRLDAAARAMKNRQAAVVELSLRYGLLDPESRPAVDSLLAEWLLSEDEALRFEARAVISDHAITSALPALEQLLTRLDDSTQPGAPFEQERIREIIASLQSAAPRG
jgi:hypothetical protein